MENKDNAYIVLQNGKVFKGKSFGKRGEALGELVFTTNMCGYVETLTDPSYFGQIVTQTFPLIGNYGMIAEDFESRGCFVKGYVVREWCPYPSNYRAGETVDEFLKKHDIVGVYGVDTRALTKTIREYGVMNARICFEGKAVDEAILNYTVKDAVAAVSTRENSTYKAQNEKFKVALLDFGAKQNIIRSLLSRGVSVDVFPYDTKAETILEGGYDGIMLSNGPGDPAENVKIIAELKKLLGRLPIFAICLGHQLLALAVGAKTTKLKYGHRGANQPVKDLKTGRVYITSQNHGYAVVADTLPSFAVQRFVNANDGTCEGIEYEELNAFTVQYHPEACAGPHDSDYLFDEFLKMLEKTNISSFNLSATQPTEVK